MDSTAYPTNPRMVDLRGKQFGHLRVVQYAGKRSKHRFWLCRCRCGRETRVEGSKLKRGSTKSCGCMKSSACAIAQLKHGGSRRRNKDAEYNIWCKMRQRCNNPKDAAYRHYGGRGIKVCDRWWDSYENFLEDMGRRPSKKHSIDRIDNDGNYEPENCQWATHEKQMQNQRKSVRLTLNGVTRCISEWARELGIRPGTLQLRKKLGWDDVEILTTPPNTRTRQSYKRRSRALRASKHARLLTHEGVTRCLREWSEVTGIKDSTLHARLKSGWSVEKTLTTPLRKR